MPHAHVTCLAVVEKERPSAGWHVVLVVPAALAPRTTPPREPAQDASPAR